MTPEEAKAKYIANLNTGLQPVLERLKSTFENRAGFLDLTETPVIDFIINIEDVKMLHAEVIAAAAKEFEEYLIDEGWNFVVKPIGTVSASDKVFTFELKEWVQPESKRERTEQEAKMAVKFAMIDSLAHRGPRG